MSVEWITESDGDVKYLYRVTEKLFSGHSDFQKIEVYNTPRHGKILLIDDFVMLTESDEFVYHEMISHVPALHLESMKNVIVVGGGDGGTVRELLKHKQVEAITLCEIDEMVVEVSKKFFPGIASGLDDPRVTLAIGDGFKYLKDSDSEMFDFAIVDSTDPIGPGKVLFSKEFYANLARVLHSGHGIAACQTESIWSSETLLRQIFPNLIKSFSNIMPYWGSVPTYPSGAWMWTIAANNSIEKIRTIEESGISNLKYLNEDIAKSCFALPEFVLKRLQSIF